MSRFKMTAALAKALGEDPQPRKAKRTPEERYTLDDLRVVRCKHFKRRFKESWDFALSLDGGLLSITGIFLTKTRPAVLVIKPIRRRLQIRALCLACSQ